MEAALAGHAPQPVHAMVILTGRKDPTWKAYARGEKLELGHWIPGAAETAPISLQFAGRGRGGKAQLRGRVQQGDQDIVLAPSNIVLENQVLHLEPLVIQAFGGTIGARGTADFTNTDDPRFRLSLALQGLNWTPAAEGDAKPVPVYLEQALLGVAGTSQVWAAYGTAKAARDNQNAELKLDVRGSQRGAFIQQLVATTPGGKASVEGKVGWEPVLAWEAKAELDGFDPGYFVPGWDGRLSGSIVSDGRQADPAPGTTEAGPLSASVNIPRLHGQLRGRALDARFTGQLRGETGSGDLRLSVGSSQVPAKGSVGERIDVDARFEPLHLDDLLPGANGTLSGTARLTGMTATPDIQANLHGSGLRWDGYAADTLSLVGHMPWRGGQGQIQLDATGLEVGMALDRVQLTGTGNLQRLQLAGTARNEMASLVLDGDVGQTASGWAGGLQALRIDPAKGVAWQLSAPTRFRTAGNGFVLEQTCLAANGGGSLCAQANWPSAGASFHAEALPLTLVQPWLPLNEGRRTHLRGQLSVDGNIRPIGNGLQGQIKLLSPEGGVRLGDNARGELLRYDNFNSTIDLTPQAINVYAGIGFQGDGFVDAKLRTGWSPNSPLAGDIYLNMSRLTWLSCSRPIWCARPACWPATSASVASVIPR